VISKNVCIGLTVAMGRVGLGPSSMSWWVGSGQLKVTHVQLWYRPTVNNDTSVSSWQYNTAILNKYRKQQNSIKKWQSMNTRTESTERARDQ